MPIAKKYHPLLKLFFNPAETNGIITYNKELKTFVINRKHLDIKHVPVYFVLVNVSTGNEILFKKNYAYRLEESFNNILHWEYLSARNASFLVRFKIIEMETLSNWLITKGYQEGFDIDNKFYPLKDRKVIKEFILTNEKTWKSWRDLGPQKNVKCWCLIEGRYAVGFNENVSKGYSYPMVKLTETDYNNYLNQK